MIKNIIKKMFVLFAFIGVNSQALAEGQTYFWKVSDLARAPSETIELRNDSNHIIKTLSTQQMLYLYSAMSAITESSEVIAEFTITTGKSPNAFASTTASGQDFIAINFAMLDLLGTNIDMAAALIGHELAHLKLGHGAERREALERNGNSSFSVSNTRYSRDNEREADYLGTVWTVEAGFDPQGAVALQEAIYKSSRSGSSASVTHPSGIERITVLKSLVRRLSK
ncbi:MAG: M48 family metallopeptidase [Gammaproteobacteria bacterium]|nr:M48 family metallopeptidase [Gammaproteobacteria bacterium]